MDDTFNIVVNEENAFTLDSSETEKLDVFQKTADSLNIIENGESLTVIVNEADFLRKKYKLKLNGSIYKIQIKDSLDIRIDEMGLAEEENTLVNELHAPMPGLLLEFQVSEGDSVSKGDALCVLEAMKMENTLTALRDGIIKTIHQEKGAAVEKGELLIEFEAE